MEFFGIILNRINRVVEYVVSIFLAIMVVVIFLQVIFRFVISSPLPWSEELARYILVWISFLGASIGVKRQSHLGIEVVTKLLSARFRKISILIANLSSIGLFIIMVRWGYHLSNVVSSQFSPAMKISMFIPQSAIFISGILMLFYGIYNLMITFKSLKEEV